MKKLVLAICITATFVSCGASATGKVDLTNPFNHATRPELAAEAKARAEADKSINADLQNSKAAGQAAYNHLDGKIDGVNADLQSSKAAGEAAYNQVQGQLGGQQTQINAVQNAAQIANEKADAGAVRMDGIEGQAKVTDDRSINNAVRLDGVEGAVRETNTALAGAVGAQQGINGQVQNQISDVNGKAVNAQNTADHAVGLGQTGINDAYNAQQTANTAVGLGQKGINDAYNAQATADNAYNKAHVAQQGVDKNSADIKATNGVVAGHTTQLADHDTRITNNTTAIKNTNTVVTQNSADIKSNTTTINQHTTQINSNTQNIAATSATVSKHTQQITSLDGRTTATEQVNTRQDVQLGQHSQALNEYGQRLATQEDISAALSQSFAGYTASSSRRMDAMQSQINSVDRKAEKAQNMGAAAFAAATLQFDTNQDAGFQIAGGAATLGGKQAMAFGAGGAVTKNLAVFANVVTASSVNGAGVSATYSFGR